MGLDVDAGRLAARKRTLDRAGQIRRLIDEFAVTAERRNDQVVARPLVAGVDDVKGVVASKAGRLYVAYRTRSGAGMI